MIFIILYLICGLACIAHIYHKLSGKIDKAIEEEVFISTWVPYMKLTIAVTMIISWPLWAYYMYFEKVDNG